MNVINNVRKNKLATLAAAAAGAVFILVATVSGSTSGFTAKVTNSANTAGSAQYFTCNSAWAADNANAVFQYPLDDSSNSRRSADLSGNNQRGTYSGSMTTTTVIPQACPRDTLGAYVLNGTNSYLSDKTLQASTNLFTEEIWFKTSSTTGGKLIGWGKSSTGASAQYDRHIWMSNSGTLNFGVYVGAIKVITSPLAYNDNQWHYAAASLSSNGMKLNVDGSLVATNPSQTAGEASGSGYWRIGYDSMNGWGANQPSNYYFTGELRYAAVYSVELTQAQITNHWDAGRSAN